MAKIVYQNGNEKFSMIPKYETNMQNSVYIIIYSTFLRFQSFFLKKKNFFSEIILNSENNTIMNVLVNIFLLFNVLHFRDKFLKISFLNCFPKAF